MFWTLLFLILGFAVVIISRALMLGESVELMEFPDEDADVEKAVINLSDAIKYKTIAPDDKIDGEWSEFDKFIKMLNKKYPNVFTSVEIEIVEEHNLLMRWKGSNPKLKPALLAAHMDVVPVEKGTEKDWNHPAFDGLIDEEYIWGRGAMDDKHSLIGILEAVDDMIAKGYVPRRDIIMAFGCDEEKMHTNGADAMAKILKERDTKLYCVIDEGGVVAVDSIDGLDRPAALIGICEKGYADVKIRIKSEGGHSSTPGNHTSIGLLSTVFHNLEKKQFKQKITTPVRDMLAAIAPYMGFGMRLISANLWLFAPILKKQMSGIKSMDALYRTTTAVTMANSGTAPNVIPQRAEGVVNFRLLPGDTKADLMDHIYNAGDGIDMDIDSDSIYEASSISPSKGDVWIILTDVIRSLFPDAVISPYLMLGGTDSRKYQDMTDCIYRFMPIKVNKDELNRLHSTNERISKENLKNVIIFYKRFIRNI